MIKNIVFDIGNVLMRFAYMPYVRELLQDEKLVEIATNAIFRTGYWDDLDLGEDTEQVLARMMAAAPGHESVVKKVFSGVGKCMFRCDYVIPWLQELKQQGYRVFYLSNYSHYTMRSNPEVLNFLPHMDGGIFSCDEKVKKPDPEIFRRLYHRYQLVPEECVFLDDMEANVEAAAASGMRAIHFNGYETARETLDQLLDAEGAHTTGEQSRILWEHPVLKIFSQICRYPHESGNEKQLSDWIVTWATARGLELEQDALGNLVIRKPARDGGVEHAPVMLQAHLDMVCEKNGDSTHDFSRDPIGLRMEGEWLVSDCGTSLGADDGIGVAAALAILEDDSIVHPPLEVVFTVQEETTFAGAWSIDTSGLSARRMINVDHADERELIVGSCGGSGARLTMPVLRKKESAEAGGAPLARREYRIMLRGLKGGHSGEDIHRGRGNAIMLLLRVLEHLNLPVVEMQGGTNRLAIPREAEAVVLSEDEDRLRKAVSGMEAVLRREYSASAPDLTVIVEPVAACGAPLEQDSFRRMAAMLRAYPNGIIQMNGNMPGLVESSDNIGVLRLEEDHLILESEVRGAYRSTIEDIRSTIKAVAETFGAEVEFFDGYLPWEPAADSTMRRIAKETYRELYGEEMRELALHAGLECGFFAEKMPGLDIISIGPDCQYFHSPEERVRISSVVRFYDYLAKLLSRVLDNMQKI